jgi:hypothetical protein
MFLDIVLTQYNQHYAKKIPPGAEAANILVGEVDFLDKPVTGFIRISKPVILGELTEVPVPTKFLFVLLGPKTTHQNYREIGRSIATLMSDEVCSLKVCYFNKSFSNEFYRFKKKCCISY